MRDVGWLGGQSDGTIQAFHHYWLGPDSAWYIVIYAAEGEAPWLRSLAGVTENQWALFQPDISVGFTVGAQLVRRSSKDCENSH